MGTVVSVSRKMLFVDASVGVGGVSSDASGVGEAGEVLLGFLVGGAEVGVSLVHDRVLVGYWDGSVLTMAPGSAPPYPMYLFHPL